jgi:hypothetical protein
MTELPPPPPESGKVKPRTPPGTFAKGGVILPPAPAEAPVKLKPQTAPGKAEPTIMGPQETAEDPLISEQRGPSNAEFAEAQWIKESMWRFENRPRGRSAQAHIGPSEMGSKCDRKIVYRLKGIKGFAHSGGPNWPAIVGTGVHSWFEKMMQWLDQDRGRFLIEHGVEIVDGEVAGTLDVYDRLMCRVRDWKFPGARAVRKYRLEGVGDQYRTQGQIYAYGLARQGETPKDIAVDMIARDASSVDQGIHVEIFPYRPSEANAAIERYKGLKLLADDPSVKPLDVEATPSALCNYCAFYAPGVRDACPGR